MIRYADPEVCPCCRESIPHAATRCDHCHTVLTGTTAEGLFRTLALADRLVAQLTVSTPVREPVVVGPGGPAHPPLLSPLDPVQPVYPAARADIGVGVADHASIAPRATAGRRESPAVTRLSARAHPGMVRPATPGI